MTKQLENLHDTYRAYLKTFQTWMEAELNKMTNGTPAYKAASVILDKFIGCLVIYDKLDGIEVATYLAGLYRLIGQFEGLAGYDYYGNRIAD